MRTVVVVIAGWAILTLSSVPHCRADQQVTLQTGTVIVGAVSQADGQIVVNVGDAELRFELDDIASVTDAVDAGRGQVDRLLLKALELQVSSGGDQQALGLLSEAYHLDPENPRVAYWYARSLCASGFGRAAKAIFEPRHHAIEKAYPGLASSLDLQIRNRIRVESLPRRLVTRLEQVAAAASAEPFYEDGELRAAYFRIVDQDRAGVRVAPQITCNGSRPKLESFGNGYYLFTYFHRRGASESPCRVRLEDGRYDLTEREFEGRALGAERAGEWVARRFRDDEMTRVPFEIVDGAGVPTPEATISAVIAGNRNQEPFATVETADDGTGDLGLFPRRYRVTAAKNGYLPATDTFWVRKNQPPETHRLVLHRKVAGNLHVAWRARPVRYDLNQFSAADVETNGQVEIHLPEDDRRSLAALQQVPFIRLQQDESRLRLFINRQWPPARRVGESPPGWCGRLKIDADNAGELFGHDLPDDERFEHIELAALDRYKPFVEINKANGALPDHAAAAIEIAPLEAGSILLGRVAAYDSDFNGRGMYVYEFKIFVKDLEMPQVER